MQTIKYIVVGAFFLTVISLGSCKHYLDFEVPVPPVDTTHIDTTHIDTTHVDTCAAGVISFKEDVLPILQSNCAKSGCHDASSHREGLITDNYLNLMNTSDISGNGTGSDFWRSINRTGNERMPPPPNDPLTAAQKNIIKTWIQQGAQNTTCSHQVGCDTTNMSFAQDIYPMIQLHCLGCHQGSSTLGGVDLAGYANVMIYVNNGQLMKSMNHDPSVVAMPYNASKLDNCTLAKFQSWINSGAPNN